MANNNRQIIVPRYPSKVGAEYTKINVIDNNDGTVSLYVQDDGNAYATNPLAITAVGDGVKGVGGGGGTVAGTAGNIPVFTAPTVIGNSLLSQSAGDVYQASGGFYLGSPLAGIGFEANGNAMQILDQAGAPIEIFVSSVNMAGWWTQRQQGGGGINFGSGHQVVWGAAATNTAAALLGDVGLGRLSAGILKVTDGANGLGQFTSADFEVINGSSSMSAIKSQNVAIGALDLWADTEHLTLRTIAGNLVGYFSRDASDNLLVTGFAADVIFDATGHIRSNKELEVTNSATALTIIKSTASGNGALDLWAEGDNLTFHNQAGSGLVGRIGRQGGSLSVRSDYGDLQLNATANILCQRPLAVSNSAAAVGAVGALANKLEVFDAAGASLGFIPIYASIS